MTTNGRVRFSFTMFATFILSSFVLLGTAAAQARPPARQPVRQSAPPSTTTTTIALGSWTVTPSVGAGFSGDLGDGTSSIGIAGGYVWSPRISFEADATFLPSIARSATVPMETSVFGFTGNALYHFRAQHDWVPYGVAGIGVGHSSADTDVLNTDLSANNFIANIGGGVEHALKNATAVRGDFRYTFGGDLVPDYWRLSAGVVLGFKAR